MIMFIKYDNQMVDDSFRKKVNGSKFYYFHTIKRILVNCYLLSVDNISWILWRENSSR